MRRLSSISSLLSLGYVRRRSYNDNLRFQSVLRCYSSQMPKGPLMRYKSLVDEGKLRYDTNQEKVAVELEKLFTRLDQYEKDMEDYYAKLAEWQMSRENERRKILVEEAEQKHQGGILSSVDKQRSVLGGNLMRRRKAENVEPGVGRWVSYLNREKKLDSVVGPRPIPPPAPKGLYLYGNVGSGKTMLMDMFYGATGSIVKHKRRLHFHEAMLNINEQMHKICKNQEEKSPQSSISSWVMNLPFDMKVKEWLSGEEKYKQELQMKHILLTVADKFLVDEQTDERGASILCFDEIQTVDVFATVALSGILSRLLTTGTVLVATSNRAPQELNQYGMQRETFQKLVSKFEEHCEIVPIGSEVDYRRYLAGAQEQVKKYPPYNTLQMQTRHFWPLESKVVKEYEEMWLHVADQLGGQITSSVIPVMFGRTLEVPESCNGAAKFTFEYLCGRPVGAADYIAIAENYHTVFLSEVPRMSMRIRDKARRFITLIDELYNHHCCLICSAAGPIDDLFQGTEDGTLFDLESFQFETEIEGVKLRRDVLAEASINSRVTPAGIGSMMSGQEEMFAFRRAVSRLIEMQTPRYLEEVRTLHPKYQSH